MSLGSGRLFRSSVNRFEESLAGVVETLRRFIIAQCLGFAVEELEGDTVNFPFQQLISGSSD